MMSPHPSVLLLGGHGKISLLMTPLILQRSWTLTSVIRAASQESDITSAAGAHSSNLHVKIADLEAIASQADAQSILDETKPDYVIFSAGAGGKPPRSRTYTIDRDACTHFINAAASTPSISKFLLVSYIGSRRSRAPWWSDEDWARTQEINNGALKDYHIAKLAADEALVEAAKRRANDGQAFTGWCLRPGALTDDNDGGVALGKLAARGKVGRGKVAQVAVDLLADGGKGAWVDCLDGEKGVEEEVQRIIKDEVDCYDGEGEEYRDKS